MFNRISRRNDDGTGVSRRRELLPLLPEQRQSVRQTVRFRLGVVMVAMVLLVVPVAPGRVQAGVRVGVARGTVRRGAVAVAAPVVVSVLSAVGVADGVLGPGAPDQARHLARLRRLDQRSPAALVGVGALHVEPRRRASFCRISFSVAVGDRTFRVPGGCAGGLR